VALVNGFLPKTEQAGTLVHTQGGSCKGHSAINQAVQHIVENETVHFHQQPSIDLYLDLHMCFDLMVKACRNLACHHHGADNAYLCLHVKTHQAMKYYVRHKFGVSNNYNMFTQHPWHGAGQGAMDAALCYIVLSTTIIDAYHTKIAPMGLNDPMHIIMVLCSLKAFIDNVVLHASMGLYYMSFQDLQQCASAQVQWWEKLVNVTSRSLHPKKCCAIAYKWQPDLHGILQLKKPSVLLDPIQTNMDHNQLPIHFVKMNKGVHYLGVYITGDCNTSPMETHLWDKALKYTAALQKTPMDCREA